jgi:hypothetical protein
MVYSQPGFGMGIIFTDVTPEQRSTLVGLLAELGTEFGLSS